MRYGIIIYAVITLTAFAAFGAAPAEETPAKETLVEEKNDGNNQNGKKIYELIDYLKLNTKDLGVFGEAITDKEKKMPSFELNSFSIVSLKVKGKKEIDTSPEEKQPKADNNETYVENVGELLEKIGEVSYIIRVQVRRAEADEWQELYLVDPFTRIVTSDLSKKEEAGVDTFHLKKDVFEKTPYLYEGMRVTVVDGDIFNAWEAEFNKLLSSVEKSKKELEKKRIEQEQAGLAEEKLKRIDDAIKALSEFSEPPAEVTNDIKGSATDATEPEKETETAKTATDYDPSKSLKTFKDELDGLADVKEIASEIEKLEEERRKAEAAKETFERNRKVMEDRLKQFDTIFTFNASDCYVRDVNDKPAAFTAKEGDELRIQIYRVDPLIRYSPTGTEHVISIESDLRFKFRDYGWRFHTSPAVFYCADANRRNRNLHNFDISTKEPAIGCNIYLTYTGPGWRSKVVNYLPSLALAVVGYYDEGKPEEGTSNGPLVEKYNEPKFSAGISYPVVPGKNQLRDIANFTLLFYDLNWEHVLFGFNFSPNIDLKGMFSRSDNPAVTGG